jgi:hypothetical protein
VLRHLVLFELAEDADHDAVAAAVDALRGLADEIEVVHELHAGRDAGLAHGNAGLALLVLVDDEDAWRTYQEHPAHQRVVHDHVRPVITGRTAAQLVD